MEGFHFDVNDSQQNASWIQDMYQDDDEIYLQPEPQGLRMNFTYDKGGARFFHPLVGNGEIKKNELKEVTPKADNNVNLQQQNVP